jgi:DNA invertase Pin-like site-specific DNA recombinase
VKTLDGYLRVSRVMGRSGDSYQSLPDQEQQIRGYMRTLKGYRLGQLHVDEDVPGTRMDRPGLQRAVERIEAGQADGIIVINVKRFGRVTKEGLEQYRRLEAKGAELIAVEGGLMGTGPFGRFMFTMLLAMGELEVGQITENWDRFRGNSVERGVHGGNGAAGYHKPGGKGTPLVPLEPHAATVTQAFQMAARGVSYAEIAEFLTQRRVPTARGHVVRWTPSNTRRLLASRVYLGEARSGNHVNAEAHPPLTDPVTFAAAQQPRARKPTGPRRYEFLLQGGLLVCAGCSQPMRGRHVTANGKRVAKYDCNRGYPHKGPDVRCKQPAIVAASAVEQWIESLCIQALRGQQIEGVTDQQGRLDDLEADLARARADRAAMLSAPGIAELSGDPEWHAALSTHTARVEDLQSELDQVRALAGGPLSLDVTADVWPTLPVADRHAVIAELIDCVVIRQRRALGTKAPVAENAVVFWRGERPDGLAGRGHRAPVTPFSVAA